MVWKMNTISDKVPTCSANQRKRDSWDTAKLPKIRQRKSRERGRVRTADFPPKFAKRIRPVWKE
ncbi:hypothetical protein T265_00808 [Opisthorchis viverrini]|uniref:Uncharacterized protein n=1 Tax=Opisthorchis viverrini TaxID=6198 RepID=A0A075ABT5_OPIVI|nr:hypothetical protein T265_00808 [Opisthorchis viverrini]KER33310.1 hypothetical protein T265_00808 [Opisthorchis viverrini]